MKSPDELTTAFRDRGLRVTPQRQAIFRILHGNDRHPTAEWVHEAARAEMPTISLKTVYQTLNDLAAMGELHQLHLGPGSARFDPNGHPHHHLVCEACGTVVDLPTDFTDLRVPDDLGLGFLVSSTEVVFRGRCAACAVTAADDDAGPLSCTDRNTDHRQYHQQGASPTWQTSRAPRPTRT